MSTLRVGIDVSSVVYGRGVSRYTSNLVTGLLHLPKEQLELSLYGYSLRQYAQLEREAKRLTAGKKVRIHLNRTAPKLQRFWWRLGQHKISSQLPGLQVFHSWDWLQPPDKSLPLVSTIHDLAMLHYPETAHPQILAQHQAAWKTLKNRQAQIIAVSQASKKDIVEQLEIPARRVHVVYEALPQETVAAAEKISDEQAEAIKSKLKLDKPYLFFVGTREPRKNLLKLIEAWQPLAKDYDLVIAGDAGWDETGNNNVLAKFKRRPRFLGRVSEADLVVLYGEAVVFVYPSLYEGFGLPILEAFYHGTPVVTSNVSSMPEVAGNAAELIKPDSAPSIRQGIETILNEDRRAQDERLKKMLVRLHLFSWQRAARETFQVYTAAAEVA